MNNLRSDAVSLTPVTQCLPCGSTILVMRTSISERLVAPASGSYRNHLIVGGISQSGTLQTNSLKLRDLVHIMHTHIIHKNTFCTQNPAATPLA